MAKGRDTWDYLAYYLQLADSAPPLEMLQQFRTPLTPLVVGLPLDLGGSRAARDRLRPPLRDLGARLERGRADVRAAAGAARRGAAPRLSGVGDALPPGLERRRLRDRPRALGASPRAHARAPLDVEVRRARRRDRRARPHPPREPGAAAGRARGAARPGAVAPPARLGGRLPRGRGRDPRRLGGAQRDPLRRHDRRPRRPRVGPVPARVARRPDHRAGERRRFATARRRSSRTRCCRRARTRSSTSRSTPTSRTARTTRR